MINYLEALDCIGLCFGATRKNLSGAGNHPLLGGTRVNGTQDYVCALVIVFIKSRMMASIIVHIYK